MNEDKMIEKKVSSELIFDGNIITLYKDVVELSNKKQAVREVIRHRGAACVVAITPENEVIVERQFRYPFKRVFTEIPAGKLDVGEKPFDCALRELKEETGAVPEKLIFIGELYPTIAYDDEIIYMFLALNVRFEERKLDEDEFLNVVKMPYDNLKKDILDGKICDAKTIAAFLKVDTMLKEGNI